MPRRLPLVLCTLLLAACGSDADRPPTTATTGTQDRAATTTTPGRAAPRTATTRTDPSPATRVPRLRAARCPTPAPANCRAASGRVVFVESVDPDGDGDLHVVAAGPSVTLPGLTSFDVRKSLRPARDPRPGDLVTGAGPVFRGSFGQRQIQVEVFRVARAGHNGGR